MDHIVGVRSGDMDSVNPEYDLKNKLCQSEMITCALSDCLRSARQALLHQRHRLCKLEEAAAQSTAMVENLKGRQEILAYRIFHMKMENLNGNLVHGWKDLLRRISALEKELDFIQSAMENLEGCTFCDLPKGYAGKEKDKHDPSNCPIIMCSNGIQEGKDYFDHEVTSLHSELFRAKFTVKQLEKANTKLQWELSASRRINENLSMELAFLKPNLQASAENITGLEDEKKELRLMIRSLREEREQLLSQRDFLIKTLTAHKRCINFACHQPGQQAPGVLNP